MLEGIEGHQTGCGTEACPKGEHGTQEGAFAGLRRGTEACPKGEHGTQEGAFAGLRRGTEGCPRECGGGRSGLVNVWVVCPPFAGLRRGTEGCPCECGVGDLALSMFGLIVSYCSWVPVRGEIFFVISLQLAKLRGTERCPRRGVC